MISNEKEITKMHTLLVILLFLMVIATIPQANETEVQIE